MLFRLRPKQPKRERETQETLVIHPVAYYQSTLLFVLPAVTWSSKIDLPATIEEEGCLESPAQFPLSL